MSKDFELLPLPFAPVDDGTKQWFAEDMRAYARANIAAALNAQAEPLSQESLLRRIAELQQAQAGVVEALEELLDEACNGIAICPLTKAKARAALAAIKGEKP